MATDPWIGERLRVERKRAGLSLAELAEMTGVSKTYLIRLETDRTSNPSLDVLQRLADALDTTIADLLGRPRVQIDAAELPVPPSLRAFSDQAGLTERETQMLASIRWRKGEQPRTAERWQFIYSSLKASRSLDEDK